MMTFRLLQSLHKTAKTVVLLTLVCLLYSGLGVQYIADDCQQLVLNLEEERNSTGDLKNKLEKVQDVKVLVAVSALNARAFALSHYLQDHPSFYDTFVLQVPTPPPEC